jgi:hypothetical protein
MPEPKAFGVTSAVLWKAEAMLLKDAHSFTRKKNRGMIAFRKPPLCFG